MFKNKALLNLSKNLLKQEFFSSKYSVVCMVIMSQVKIKMKCTNMLCTSIVTVANIGYTQL